MRVYDGLKGLTPDAFRDPVVTVGMFDGLHRGHQQVLRCLTERAQTTGGESVVVSFDTHPMAVITGAPPRPILTPPHRLRLLGEQGVDATVLLAFDASTRAMTYRRFVEDVLVERLGLRALLFGYNSNFGFGGEGTPTSVRPLADAFGFDIYEAPAIDVGARPISSTRIREAIAEGAFDIAAEMLGRPISVMGRVIRGDGRGRDLGFPTANIDVGCVVLPPTGVYRVDVELDRETLPAIANLGTRPTFHDAHRDRRLHLEVHIPNFRRDLYGTMLLVTFLDKIRDELKFHSVDDLKSQIARDLRSLHA